MVDLARRLARCIRLHINQATILNRACIRAYGKTLLTALVLNVIL
jgi:hypothetical protein